MQCCNRMGQIYNVSCRKGPSGRRLLEIWRWGAFHTGSRLKTQLYCMVTKVNCIVWHDFRSYCRFMPHVPYVHQFSSLYFFREYLTIYMRNLNATKPYIRYLSFKSVATAVLYRSALKPSRTKLSPPLNTEWI